MLFIYTYGVWQQDIKEKLCHKKQLVLQTATVKAVKLLRNTLKSLTQLSVD
jgi:hypothetical protein